ncbi:hypothetical protein HDC90_001140 [Pedobacter sp. AK013]|uniref:hypothetical protein n=1 Tax=Pedobacter sp. AK013 TaxID=2723071 RepID=UPI00160851A6|nr:hypothetical protein [Pedobacter sp. AK013]MBB6236528.1 hypothetical protein [Pedobacter sp. AK013]
MEKNLDLVKNDQASVEIAKAEAGKVAVIDYTDKTVLANPPAFTLPENDTFNAILAEIIKAYNALAWKLPLAADLSLMAEQLNANVRENYKQIRCAEIAIAFSFGIRKEYGEFMGLSLITFEMFIKGYLNSRHRAELAKSLPSPDLKKEPTPVEKFKTAAGNAMETFLAYQANRDVTVVAPVVYRFLMKIKIIQYDDDAKQTFLNQAVIDVVKDLNMQKTMTTNRDLYNTINKILQTPSKIEDKAILQAQRLGLYAFFDSVMAFDIDLQELINEKRLKLFPYGN